MDGQPGLPAIFLISQPAINHLQKLDLQDLEREVARLSCELFEIYRSYGLAKRLLPVVCSLNEGLAPLRGRGSLEVARCLGLEASLHLASASPGGAQMALVAAQRSVNGALAVGDSSSVRDVDRMRLVAEQEMISAVALKASGDLERCVDHCRSATRYLGDPGLAIPLIRQWALIEQDAELFARVVDLTVESKGVSDREEYRSLKRSFEYHLNQGNQRESERLVRPLLSAYQRSQGDLDHIARVSLVKNLGQFLGMRGEGERALRMLAIAGLLARRAGFDGQVRQVAELARDMRDGRDLDLATFRVPPS